LSRDPHGGEHRVDSIADVLERFRPGDLGLDDLVQGVPKRDELFRGASQGPDEMASGVELLANEPAEIAGGAGDENAFHEKASWR
jgi:hypothetical protein